MHPKSAPSFFHGGIFLPRVTPGYCRFSQHFSGKDFWAYGSIRVPVNLFGWFVMHHQDKPGQPPWSCEVSPCEVARSRLVCRCPQIQVLGYWNIIPWVYRHEDKHIATTNQRAGNPCNYTALNKSKTFIGSWAWSRMIEIFGQVIENAFLTRLFARRVWSYQSHGLVLR